LRLQQVKQQESGDGMHNRTCIRAAVMGALGLALAHPPASALDFSLGEVDVRMLNKFAIGAGWRMQKRDNSLLGKLNVPGQQNLCDEDDCISFSGDPEPNQRLVDAEGGFFFQNTDNGNLNYDRGDLITGLAKYNSELTASWRNLTLRTTFVGFFDALNFDFTETNTNTRLQPAEVPRSGEIEHRLAMRGEFREAFIAAPVPLPFVDRELFLSLGRQRLRWGESQLHLFNTLDAINPLDAVLTRQPGFSINELNLPVGMALAGVDLTDRLSLEAFYQYEWRPVRPEPSGSFFSSVDAAGGGTSATLGLGQFPEDPMGQFQPAGDAALLSSSHRTVFVPSEFETAARDSGQFGAKLSWFAENLFGGTELGFYFANLHSRLPYFSVIAAEESCARDSSNIVEAFADCEGFNGALASGGEPFPVDTLRVFLDHPEDVRMLGVSFTVPMGRWSLSGEYSYRPNMPVQVLISDVIFAGLQPAFPRQDIPLNPTGLDPGVIPIIGDLLDPIAGDTTGAIIPGSRTFVPDFVSTVHRGVEVHPGDVVRGYERLKVGQFSLAGLRLFSTNPFRADDMLVMVEAGFSHVIDMPGETIYFQGMGDQSHPSPGADGSGFPEGTDPETAEVTARINPTQQTSGFADDFAWGLRSFVQLGYSNVLMPGLVIKPTVFAFWDVGGISTFPAQNYVEGNVWVIGGFFYEFKREISGSVLYQHFRGRRNLLRDRDALTIGIELNF
jgi:hypothetical protein